jgi:hypothetical protein
MVSSVQSPDAEAFFSYIEVLLLSSFEVNPLSPVPIGSVDPITGSSGVSGTDDVISSGISVNAGAGAGSGLVILGLGAAFRLAVFFFLAPFRLAVTFFFALLFFPFESLACFPFFPLLLALAFAIRLALASHLFLSLFFLMEFLRIALKYR